MEISTKNRAELKSFFKKNSIPTEEQFAFLIDGMMNPQDDGLVKSADTPLSIQAIGDDASPQPVLHLYNNISDDAPMWVIGINSQTRLSDDQENQPGFHISDGAGASRLFINQSGDIGIGTTQPRFKLHVIDSGGFGGEDADGLSSGGNVPIVAQSNSTAIGIINGSGRQAFALNINHDGGTKEDRGVPVFHDKFDGTWRASLFLKLGRVGIGTNDPQTQLHISGGRWNLDATDGDFMIGSTAHNLRIGVATGGSGAGDISFRAKGTTNRMMFGGGETHAALTVQNDRVGVGNDSPSDRLHVSDGDIAITGGRYRRLKIVSDAYWAGIELVARGIGEAGHPHIDFTHGNLDSPNYGVRLYAPNNDQLEITGRLKVGDSVAGGETRTGWVLGKGAWGPDNWLRLTTSQGGGTYHDLAVDSFWAAGASRFDLSEVTPVDPAESLQQGDVVVIDREQVLRVTRSRVPRDTAVYGIVSSYEQAAMVIGGADPQENINRNDRVPIALVGRVQAKVSSENGEIHIGDLLTTSSTPGHLMKCDDLALARGSIAGKALESLADDRGIITILVTLQ